MCASMISSQSFLCLYLYSDGDYQAGTHSPQVLRLSRSGIVYLRRILRALNLYKKTEYTARIAPAQLGKAIVNRYRRPAATVCDCFSGLDLSADMCTQISGPCSRKTLASTEASF